MRDARAVFSLLPRPAPVALAGRRVLVLGLGDTGLSVARWVARAGRHARASRTRAPRRRARRISRGELHTGPFGDGAARRRGPACASAPGSRSQGSRRAVGARAGASRSSATSSSSPGTCAPTRRPGARDHRHQRQDHGDGADRPPAARGRASTARSPATSARRRSTRCMQARSAARGLGAGALQLPAGDDLVARAGRRGDAQPERRPSRPLAGHRGLRRGQGAHLPGRGRAGAQPRRLRARWPWRSPGRDAGHLRPRRARRGRRISACADGRAGRAGDEPLLPVRELPIHRRAQRRQRARRLRARARAGRRSRSAGRRPAQLHGPAAPAAARRRARRRRVVRRLQGHQRRRHGRRAATGLGAAGAC